MKINFTLILKLSLFSVFALLIAFGAHTYITQLFPAIFISCAAIVLLAFALKLFEVRKVREIFTATD